MGILCPNKTTGEVFCVITHPRQNPNQRQKARSHLYINNHGDDRTLSTNVQPNSTSHKSKRTVPRNFTFELKGEFAQRQVDVCHKIESSLLFYFIFPILSDDIK